MNNTINGRTPEEIKKGLEMPCADEIMCKRCRERYNCYLEADALAYIQQLEREREELVKNKLFSEGTSLDLREVVKVCEGELLVAAINMISDMQAAQPKWISVEEMLPQAFYSVLVYIPEEAPMPTVHEGYMTDNGRWISTVYVREFEKVTHWMPLPEPPQEEA